MEFISSDTNVWLDFELIGHLDLPFKLPYKYLMNDDAVHEELLSPPNLGKRLVSLGLIETELTEEEFFLAEEYMMRYRKTSKYDCIALAIAKKTWNYTYDRRWRTTKGGSIRTGQSNRHNQRA